MKKRERESGKKKKKRKIGIEKAKRLCFFFLVFFFQVCYKIMH